MVVDLIIVMILGWGGCQLAPSVWAGSPFVPTWSYIQFALRCIPYFAYLFFSIWALRRHPTASAVGTSLVPVNPT